jgi:16S rRNA processing protein RimM
MEGYTAVGHTSKTHGVRGEIKIKADEQYVEDLLRCETLFIELRGKAVPYFVEQLRGGMDIIAKFEDVDSREEAQMLCARTVFIRNADVLPDEVREILVEKLEFGGYVGYEIVDKKLGPIGPIESIEAFPQQEMALLQYAGAERMVPMSHALIVAIDAANKRIDMDLPEGLLDL